MHLEKRIKAVLMTALAAMAISAVGGASAASAELVPANFSSSGFKMTVSNLTVRANGIEPKTCTSATLNGYAEKSQFLAGTHTGYAESKFTCGGLPGPNFTMVFHGEALYDTVSGKYSLHVYDFGSWSLQSPWGSYSQESGIGSDATWVNGSGGTASTATFKSQTIGWTFGGKQLSIDGTFKVTNSAGGLLTLSH